MAVKTKGKRRGGGNPRGQLTFGKMFNGFLKNLQENWRGNIAAVFVAAFMAGAAPRRPDGSVGFIGFAGVLLVPIGIHFLMRRQFTQKDAVIAASRGVFLLFVWNELRPVLIQIPGVAAVIRWGEQAGALVQFPGLAAGALPPPPNGNGALPPPPNGNGARPQSALLPGEFQDIAITPPPPSIGITPETTTTQQIFEDVGTGLEIATGFEDLFSRFGILGSHRGGSFRSRAAGNRFRDRNVPRQRRGMGFMNGVGRNNNRANGFRALTANLMGQN